MATIVTCSQPTAAIYQPQPIIQSAPAVVVHQPAPPPQIIQPAPAVVVHQPAPPPQIIQPVSQMIIQSQPTSDGRVLCSACNNRVVPIVEYRNGALNWLICASLGIFGIWPFCLIPFCVDSCKDEESTCPCCNRVLYVRKRL